MTDKRPRRVAFLGFMLESNNFAPVITEQDFRSRVYLAGDALLVDLANPDTMLPTELRGFFEAMDQSAEWSPVPIFVGLGPCPAGLRKAARL